MTFDNSQHHFKIQTLNKPGIDENFLSLLKSIYEKPTVNIILSGERLKAFCSQSRQDKGAPRWPSHLSIRPLGLAQVMISGYMSSSLTWTPRWQRGACLGFSAASSLYPSPMYTVPVSLKINA